MDKIRAQLGERLRTLRKAQGWSQEELGARANLHPTYVGGIERGERNVSLNNMTKLAQALHVSMAELLQFPAQDPPAMDDPVRRRIKTLIAGQERLASKFFSTYCLHCDKLRHFTEFRALLKNSDDRPSEPGS